MLRQGDDGSAVAADAGEGELSCRTNVRSQPQMVARVELRSVANLPNDVVTMEEKDGIPTVIIWRARRPGTRGGYREGAGRKASDEL